MPWTATLAHAVETSIAPALANELLVRRRINPQDRRMTDSISSGDRERREADADPLAADVTSGTEGFRRNTLINISGLAAPIILSFVTVPLYLHQIGAARYGVLAVVWGVLGYFAVFELGLGRATTNQVARLRTNPAERETVFWNALLTNLVIGCLGALLLYFIGHAILGTLLKAPLDLRSEALGAVPWLALAVPLTTAAAVVSGALEGRERFLTLNVVTVAGLSLYQLAPLAYAYLVGPDLAGLIMTSTLALLGSLCIGLAAVAWALPLKRLPRVERRATSGLLRYGGWVAVGGFTGPFFTVLDRVLIGVVLGARSVAQYAIPSALVTRTLILPIAFARTIFPRLSSLGHGEAARVSDDAARGMVAVTTPVVVIGIVLMEPFLRIWAGEDIAVAGSAVGEILFVGVWLNGIAVIPYALLQAQGRPDVTAKIHVLEVAPYFGALWVGLHVKGLNGAAWAWSARAGVDAFLLFWAARRGGFKTAGAARRPLFGGALFVTAACACALTVFDHSLVRIVGGASLIASTFVWSWRLAPLDVRRAVWPRRRRASAQSPAPQPPPS
jgi:O-antigen/teichoic acid export membrane protein